MDSFEKNVIFSIIVKGGKAVNIDLGTVSNIDLIMDDDDRYILSPAAYLCRIYPQNTEFLITLALIEELKLKFLNKLNINLHNDNAIEYVLIKHLEKNTYKKAKLILY